MKSKRRTVNALIIGNIGNFHFHSWLLAFLVIGVLKNNRIVINQAVHVPVGRYGKFVRNAFRFIVAPRISQFNRMSAAIGAVHRETTKLINPISRKSR